jgi:hypothetical protein
MLLFTVHSRILLNRAVTLALRMYSRNVLFVSKSYSSGARPIYSISRKSLGQLWVVGYWFVVVVFGQEEGSCRDAGCINQHHNPRDGAKDPGFVELPSNEEARVILVKCSLQEPSASGHFPQHQSSRTYHQSHRNQL